MPAAQHGGPALGQKACTHSWSTWRRPTGRLKAVLNLSRLSWAEKLQLLSRDAGFPWVSGPPERSNLPELKALRRRFLAPLQFGPDKLKEDASGHARHLSEVQEGERRSISAGRQEALFSGFVNYASFYEGYKEATKEVEHYLCGLRHRDSVVQDCEEIRDSLRCRAGRLFLCRINVRQERTASRLPRAHHQDGVLSAIQILRQLQTCVAGVAPGGRGGGRLVAWGTRLSPLSSWSSICLERGTPAYANVVHGALRRRFTVPVAVSLLRLGAAMLLWGRLSAAGAGTLRRLVGTRAPVEGISGLAVADGVCPWVEGAWREGKAATRSRVSASRSRSVG